MIDMAHVGISLPIADTGNSRDMTQSPEVEPPNQHYLQTSVSSSSQIIIGLLLLHFQKVGFLLLVEHIKFNVGDKQNLTFLEKKPKSAFTKQMPRENLMISHLRSSWAWGGSQPGIWG
jgi:hypothetical protein